MGSTYTTDAAYPVTFMPQGLQQHLARPQYGGSVSSPASLLCVRLFLKKTWRANPTLELQVRFTSDLGVSKGTVWSTKMSFKLIAKLSSVAAMV